MVNDAGVYKPLQIDNVAPERVHRHIVCTSPTQVEPFGGSTEPVRGGLSLKWSFRVLEFDCSRFVIEASDIDVGLVAVSRAGVVEGKLGS